MEENDAAIAQRVEALAAEKGVSRAQVALAWLLHKPAVTAPIIGASRAEQPADLVKAIEAELSAEEVAEQEGSLSAAPDGGLRVRFSFRLHHVAQSGWHGPKSKASRARGKRPGAFLNNV
nr:Phosphatidylglycerophosphatase A [Candidatus Pantoea persica]